MAACAVLATPTATLTEEEKLALEAAKAEASHTVDRITAESMNAFLAKSHVAPKRVIVDIPQPPHRTGGYQWRNPRRKHS